MKIRRIVAAVLLAGTAAFAQDALYKTGDTVRPFVAADLADKEVSLADLKGKVVLLNFFSTRCANCAKEAPRLEKEIWQAEKAKGLVVVGITKGTAGAKEFRTKHGVSYPIWVDKEGTAFETFVGDKYVPYNVVIDKEGTVRYANFGFEPEKEAEIKKVLGELLAAPAAEAAEKK
jgi:peroxiredoxin